MSHKLSSDLRQSVFEAAISGKLSSYCEEDTPIKKTLETMQKHREKLFSSKQEKPSKPTGEITDFELFDIPQHWEWVQLGDVGTLTRGSGITKSEVTNTGRPCIRYGQMYTTYRIKFSKTVSFVSEDTFNKSPKVQNGDVLMALTGENNFDIALAVAYLGEELVAMGGDMTKWSNHHMNSLYLVMIINSEYGISWKRKMAKGNIIVHISNDKLANIYLPLPPIEEQSRIVAKVEELMIKIDEYEKIENHLSKLQTKFPSEMKASLLQAAMQGKLIGKNWNIEDNPEMYTPIWKLTAWDKKFKNVSKNKQKETRKYHYYLASEMKAVEKPTGDVFLLSTGDYSGWTTEETVGDTLCEGEIVSIPWGGYPNVKYYKGKFITSDNRIATSTDLGILSNRYLYYFMLSQVDYLDSIYRGTGLRHPDMSAVLEMLIPLPSVLEQELIVKKLDLLLPMCESLETK